MTPTPALELSDAALDQLIEQFRPNLRAMLRSTIRNEVPIHMLDIAKVPLPSGQEWTVYLCVMHEPFCALVTGAVSGFNNMAAAFDKQKAAPQPQNQAPPAFEFPI